MFQLGIVPNRLPSRKHQFNFYCSCIPKTLH